MIKEIDVTKKPLQDQIKMLNRASMLSASEDDEYPELSERDLCHFKKVANRDKMKTIDEYMNKDYELKIVEDPDEGGFVAFYPELPGCITCGETLEEAAENALDAKRAWIEAALEDGFMKKDSIFVDCKKSPMMISDSKNIK